MFKYLTVRAYCAFCYIATKMSELKEAYNYKYRHLKVRNNSNAQSDWLKFISLVVFY